MVRVIPDMSLFTEDVTRMKELPPEHYYGDIVRKLFLVSALIMLFTLAFFSDLIVTPVYISIGGAIVIVFLAGLQNPRHLWLNVLNTIVSAVACYAFAYTGIQHYLTAVAFNAWFFWSSQALAIAFLLATYFSSKTIRAIFMGKA